MFTNSIEHQRAISSFRLRMINYAIEHEVDVLGVKSKSIISHIETVKIITKMAQNILNESRNL